jgi:hypothetical protein
MVLAREKHAFDDSYHSPRWPLRCFDVRCVSGTRVRAVIASRVLLCFLPQRFSTQETENSFLCDKTFIWRWIYLEKPKATTFKLQL